MSNQTEISVVMGVFNGEQGLLKTVESVLAQEEVSFEFIIVDDGSTDATPDILSELAARDGRLRVVSQSNQGLTRALMTGCEAANGFLIARQDCGDLSLPGRFKRQRDLLIDAPGAIMVSCGTRFVAPDGETVQVVSQTTPKLQRGLDSLTLDGISGPSHHGSTMFRREAYEHVGGYRAVFRVAQDLDLWLRFREAGAVLAIPDVLYEASLSPGSVSANHREAQMAAAKTILSCASARREGRSEASYLQEYSTRPPDKRPLPRKRADAEFYYHVASLLRREQPQRARVYYKRSLQTENLYLPAWIGLVRTWIAR